MLDWQKVMSDSVPTLPGDFFGRAVPLVGYDSQHMLVHCHEPFYSIANLTFEAARNTPHLDRATIFITGPGVRPAKELDILGLGALARRDRRVGFFDIAWDRVFSDFGYGGTATDLHERFDDYAETGVVDFDYEENMMGYRAPKKFIREDGAANIDKIVDYLSQSGSHYYEEIFFAIPQPDNLPPEDLSRMQEAILSHLENKVNAGKVPGLFEGLRKLVQRYFDSFKIVEKLMPRMIHGEVAKVLPSYHFTREDNNIETLRGLLAKHFPDEADEICEQIQGTPDLYNFFNWLHRRTSFPLIASAQKHLEEEKQSAALLGQNRKQLLLEAKDKPQLVQPLSFTHGAQDLIIKAILLLFSISPLKMSLFCLLLSDDLNGTKSKKKPP